MATVTTYNTSDSARPDGYPRQTLVRRAISVANAAGASGDVLTLETLKAGEVVTQAQLYAGATLGASCTIQLRAGSTAITAATTAGGASYVAQNVLHAQPASDTTVNLLIGGASIGAAATVYVSYLRSYGYGS